MNGKINVIMRDDFTVLDLSGIRKPAIPLIDFTKTLYNPSGTQVSGTIPVTIVELANGDYRASYTPNAVGLWKLTIFHATYFPTGKENSHQIYTNDIDSVGLETDKIKFILGLSQENFRLYNQVFDGNINMTNCKARTYSSKADAIADINPLATYTITATYNVYECTSYLVTKD